MKIALLNEVNEINKSLEEKKNSECSHSYWETVVLFQSLDVLQDNFQCQDNQKKENFYSENISGMIYILLTLA